MTSDQAKGSTALLSALTILDFVYKSEHPPLPPPSQALIDSYKLPPGWEIGISINPRYTRLPFLINSSTQSAQWKHPTTNKHLPPLDRQVTLPAGWFERRKPNGQSFYFEPRTSRATTEYPLDIAHLDLISIDLPPNYQVVRSGPGKDAYYQFYCKDTKVFSDSNPSAHHRKWCETYAYIGALEAEFSKGREGKPMTFMEILNPEEDVFVSGFRFVMGADVASLKATLRVALFTPGVLPSEKSPEQIWLDAVMKSLFDPQRKLFVAKEPGKVVINKHFEHADWEIQYIFAGRVHGIAIVQALKVDLSFVEEIFLQLPLYQGSKPPGEDGSTEPRYRRLFPDPKMEEKMKAFMSGLFQLVPVDLFTNINELFNFKLALRSRCEWEVLYKVIACVYGPQSAMQKVVAEYTSRVPRVQPVPAGKPTAGAGPGRNSTTTSNQSKSGTKGGNANAQSSSSAQMEQYEFAKTVVAGIHALRQEHAATLGPSVKGMVKTPVQAMALEAIPEIKIIPRRKEDEYVSLDDLKEIFEWWG